MRKTESRYAHRTFDPEIGMEIAFRPLVLEEDLERVHAWMNEEHVIPFWRMAWPEEKIKVYLQNLLDDPHSTPYIGYLDGVPMSYWEAYRAADDVVATRYQAHPEDRGVHLLIGPPEYLGRGYALPLLRAMTAFQFADGTAEKVVAEPDVRNARMIHVFKKCAYEPQGEIELPDKRALLMFCRRERFEGRFPDALG
ncbi:rhizobactin siderophore biosynthesis protein RhbD [Rubrobacter xylanophilus]|uniref:Lysine N-acyltransferase MbtK n=2 Tax=Rubrobacter xylanophilus TaxID=49319 RepID=A0A510HLS4_9ACTN|nr:GNAT family N-acetyltransferase [Rubrobacter xylanophilus]BBL80949.1 rhizobactin siderophore biosynthesis protein RhbD [Rubrobacter xylanophilus]